MTKKQDFVGEQPVDQIPEEAKQKIPDEELTKRDAERLSMGEHHPPGAAVRAGVAARDPKGARGLARMYTSTVNLTLVVAILEFDTKSGGWGDPKPVKGVLLTSSRFVISHILIPQTDRPNPVTIIIRYWCKFALYCGTSRNLQ
ncbi:hypothetical protein ID866_5379 [Astraeus odoratus]|nr:hypothetical protein ID866_5379 [Astraeus odoratus]